MLYLCALEDAPNLVADLARLKEAAVCQGRIIGRRRGEVPPLISGVEAVAMSEM